MPLSKEEAVARYGNVHCQFSSYWKYSFSFSGVADDGAEIRLSTGGNAADIYRYDIGPKTTIVMEDACSATIVKNGEVIFEDHDC